VALDNNVVVGLGADGAFTISPADGSSRTIIDGAYVRYLGDDGRTLLVATDASDRQQALKLIRGDSQLVDVHPDAVGRMLGGPAPMHDVVVVVGAGQGVGLIDPTTGEGHLVGEGALITASRALLIRVICQPDLHCNWIIGGYDGNQHHAIDAPTDTLGGFGLGIISTDGTTLIGLAFGPGPPVLHVMDLSTGAIRPVDNPPQLDAIFDQQFALTHDGRWLVTRNTSGDIELISLSDPSRHTLDQPGAIQALTVTG
ncbi:MAG: hypothetical protein OEY23_25145, partial [Acidimicrobiia bacterium]|nr:hypothetical protein [Acidimicrobiia bacterium]